MIHIYLTKDGPNDEAKFQFILYVYYFLMCLMMSFNDCFSSDMGLGKTVQTIGLIMSNPPEGRDGKKRYPYKKPTTQIQPPRCTLIVSPVSVMSNWKMEFNKFVNKKRDILQIDFYRGPTREKQLKRIKNQEIDILIASYQTLMHDFRKYEEHVKEQKKRKDAGKPLRSSDKTFIHDMTFHRIVLDEGTYEYQYVHNRLSDKCPV